MKTKHMVSFVLNMIRSIRFLIEILFFIYFSWLAFSLFHSHYQINVSLIERASDQSHFSLSMILCYFLMSPIFFLFAETWIGYFIFSKSEMVIYGWWHILIIFLTGYYTWFILFPRVGRFLVRKLYKRFKCGHLNTVKSLFL